jgi:hypothetical protein
MDNPFGGKQARLPDEERDQVGGADHHASANTRAVKQAMILPEMV